MPSRFAGPPPSRERRGGLPPGGDPSGGDPPGGDPRVWVSFLKLIMLWHLSSPEMPLGQAHDYDPNSVIPRKSYDVNLVEILNE
jgi:hypothetical protein